MKTKTSLFTVLVALCLNIAPFVQAVAKDGGVGSGGGDLKAERMAKIKTYIETQLKNDVRAFAKEIDPNTVSDVEIQVLLMKMLWGTNLENDLESKYVPSTVCRNRYKKIKEASTDIGQLLAPICFNLDLLADQNATADDMVRIALHEHAHHFGWGDNEGSEHTLSQYFTVGKRLTDSLSENSRNFGVGDVAFYLKKSAVETGILGPREITTDWILVDGPDQNPIDQGKIQELVQAVLEQNQSSNPSFQLKIESLNSEVARLVTEVEARAQTEKLHQVDRDRDFQLKARAGIFHAPRLIVIKNNSFRHVDYFTYRREYKDQAYFVKRYVVGYVQTLSSVSNDELEQARINMTIEFEQKSRSVLQRLQAALTVPAANQVIDLPKVTYRYKNKDEEKSQSCVGHVTYGNMFQLQANSFAPTVSVTQSSWTDNNYDIGITHDSRGAFTVKQRCGHSGFAPTTDSVETLSKYYIQQTRMLVDEYFNLAEEAYDAATDKGLPVQTAKEIVRKFTRMRERIYTAQQGLVLRRFDNSGTYIDEKILIIEASRYPFLLLPDEHD